MARIRINSHRSRWTTAVAAALLAVCALRAAVAEPPAAIATVGELTADIELSDWGLGAVGDIGHVEIGILGAGAQARLVVYRVDRSVPQKADTTSRARAPDLSGGVFVIDDYASGNTNRLGGYFSAFARAPSRSDVEIEDAGEGIRALTMSYRRDGSGFAGSWIHLFDMKAREREYLDARGAAFLTFRVRGGRGGEPIRLKIADRDWEAKGDAVVVAALEDLVPAKRITTEWQRAWLALDRVPTGLDRGALASLVFEVAAPGEGRLQVTDVALASSRDAVVAMPTNAAAASAPATLRTTLWVWETTKLAAGTLEREEFVSFCRGRGITDVYLQVPERGPSSLAGLVAALHQAGIGVDALDGAPRFALPEHHGEVLAIVRSVAEHNRTAAQAERFDGIRFDIEPYLLSGFHGVSKRKVLRGYVTVLERAKDVAHRAGLRFGVDIPFWFDSFDPEFAPVAALDGRPVSEMVIEIADNVAIMDYRTMAYGPDGVLAHAEGEFAFAAAHGKPLLIGLETVALPDETIQRFTQQGEGARIVLEQAGPDRVRLRWFSAVRWSALRAGGAPLPVSRVLAQIDEQHVDAAKVSFDRWSPARLERVMAQVRRELASSPAFAGFALHSYESLRPWVARRGSTGGVAAAQNK